jgi:hypothetical protein
LTDREKAQAVEDILQWGHANEVELLYELPDARQLDVFDLAPTLVAMGQLIQEAHRTVYPEGPELVITVRPFQPGSFDIPTIITYGAPILAQGLFPGGVPRTPKEIYETLKHLGMVAHKGYTSVRDVIRKLGGKPEEIKKTRSGFTVKRGDKTINVNGDVGKLVQINNVYNNTYQIYGAPIEKGTSKSVRTYAKRIPDSEVRVEAPEAKALKAAADSKETPTVEKEKLKRKTYKAALHPIRGPFGGDSRQWSFLWGEKTIVATIKDKKFLKDYEDGGARLNTHDTMHVQLVEKQKLIGDEVQSVSYEVKKVDRLTFGPVQQKLLKK